MAVVRRGNESTHSTSLFLSPERAARRWVGDCASEFVLTSQLWLSMRAMLPHWLASSAYEPPS